MSDFHDVVNEFTELIEKYEFVLPKKLWYDNIVVFSKRIEDIIFCHVIARVFKQNGSLQTDLWVAPIDRPDDGLENLSAGIKTQIDFVKEPGELFFKRCEKKILSLLEDQTFLSNKIEISKHELRNPTLKNRRYTVYTTYELPMFREILLYTNFERKVLKSKKDVYSISEILFKKLTGDKKKYFNLFGLQNTKEIMWQFCYLYSL